MPSTDKQTKKNGPFFLLVISLIFHPPPPPPPPPSTSSMKYRNKEIHARVAPRPTQETGITVTELC